jgi:Na+/proline symporter
MPYDLGLLIAATLAFVVYGFAVRRGREGSDEGKLGWAQIAAGLGMTYIGGAATIAMTGIGYANGMIGLVDPIAVLAGGLLVAILVREETLRKAGEGVARFLAHGSRTRTVVYGLCSLFVYTLLASAQLVALEKIFSPYMGESPATATALTAFLLIAVYIYIGGIAAVTKADILQFFVVLFFFFIPAAWGVTQLLGEESTRPAVTQTPLDVRTILLLSLSLLFVPLSQDIWVRVRRAQSATAARTGIVTGVFIYFAVVGMAVVLGHTAARSGMQVADPETLLASFFATQLGLAGVITSIVILVAVLSSLDAFTYNLNATLSEDLWPPRFKLWNQRGRRAAALVVVFSTCSFIAVYATSILGLVLSALMAYVCVIGPGFILGRYAVRDVTVWAPALLTLSVVVFLTASKVVLPFEPYSIFAGHLILLAALVGVERAFGVGGNDR